MFKTKGFRRSSFPVFLLAGLLGLLFSSCGPNETGSRTVNIASDPGLLRVGVSANAPPLIYSENNTITGLEAEFARKLARFTGKKVTFIKLKWEDQIPALENNKIDIIMSGMPITQARQSRINFSIPYLRSGQILLVRLGEKDLFSNGTYSLMNSNYVIGTIKDSPGDFFITKTPNRAKVKKFTKPSDAVKALINKDIDVFIYDAPRVCHYAAMNEDKKLTPILTLATEEYIAWGIHKDDSELLSQANAFLTDLKTQQKLPRMIRTWIPYM
jgi:polar amino acid transport system substrate-binding protein